jgi:oligopeptidase B
MSQMKLHRLLLVLVVACASQQHPKLGDGAQAPVAKKEPHPQTLFGETLPDDYFWLRNKGTPEVEQYLNAETAYADREMAETKPLQEKLYAEMLSRVQEDDSTAPVRVGTYLYWYRTDKGKQYRTLLRKPVAGGAEQIVIDENAMAASQKFFAVGGWQVSDDGNLLAYSTDTTGYRQYDLHVRDLRTGVDGPEKIARVDSFCFTRDGGWLFYVIEDETEKRPYQLYRHALGSAGGAGSAGDGRSPQGAAPKDEAVYEEKDHRFRLEVGRGRSKDFIFVTSASHTASEVRFFGASDPKASLILIEPRQDNHEYYADARGGMLWIRTNSGGRNFRVVIAPIFAPGRDNWREVIPYRTDVMIDDFDVFRDFVALHEREGGLPQISIVDPETFKERRLAFPEPDYDVRPGINPEYDQTAFRIRYQSFITPPSDIDADARTLKQTTVKQQPVPNYDQTKYAVERVWITAKDGKRVPVAMVHRKDAGKGPMLLGAYGSYGFSLPDAFNSNIFSLVDRGVTYAVAHIRGGGEFGKEWHDDGRMMHKVNTFDDFIACAEGLIQKGYTTRTQLAITGGSAGGLLMGAVLNARPDLFQTAVVHVPFVDVINTMLDESLPLTVGEFEEWGNPKKEAEYRYIRKYSPYDNVKAQPYPAMLVKSSYNDSQVGYWEPAKWVARLRATKTDGNPLLFRINMEPAGHGGASGRYNRLRENAYDFAFVLSEVAPGAN